MTFSIEPLTPGLTDAYLHFFRTRGFVDHPDWSTCYCLSFCLTNPDKRVADEIDCSTDPAVAHERMSRMVRTYVDRSELRGYLAMSQGAVIGWCNTNTSAEYQRFDDWEEENPGHNAFLMDNRDPQAKAVTCFLIDPDHRSQGVATALLSRVIADATAEGYQAVEGFPRHHEQPDPYDFTGPMALYQAAGFAPVATGPGVTIMRKALGDWPSPPPADPA